MSEISSKWFVDVNARDPEAKRRREDLIKAGGAVLSALATVIAAEIIELSKTASESYDTPNWALKEADRQGQLRALRKVQELTKGPKNA